MIEKIEAALRAIPYPTEPQGLYEPIAYTLALGGKRIRPRLLLLAYSLYRDDVERALPAAIGLETYHNHTLLHDDLMDKADVRRGKPTVHRKWDANTAILSGDTMLILAFRHFLALDVPNRHEVLELFARTAQEICEGQQYDMNFESRTEVSEAEYIEMIRLKTSVLLACAARAGALIAGAPQADADALYAFGERTGLAFQLQDDYLDCYGDPAVFGKKTGGDILCGKKTFLLINALGRASEAQRAELLRLTAPDCPLPPQERIDGVLAIYDRLGIGRLTLQRIDQIYAEAGQSIDAIGLPEERKQPLRDFADGLLNRRK